MSKTIRFNVVYEKAPEGGIVAFVPALPGCHSQGETLEEATKNIKEAIELYIESLVESGESIPDVEESFYGTVEVGGLKVRS